MRSVISVFLILSVAFSPTIHAGHETSKEKLDRQITILRKIIAIQQFATLETTEHLSYLGEYNNSLITLNNIRYFIESLENNTPNTPIQASILPKENVSSTYGENNPQQTPVQKPGPTVLSNRISRKPRTKRRASPLPPKTTSQDNNTP